MPTAVEYNKLPLFGQTMPGPQNVSSFQLGQLGGLGGLALLPAVQNVPQS
jgi:hypothetical protein